MQMCEVIRAWAGGGRWHQTRLTSQQPVEPTPRAAPMMPWAQRATGRLARPRVFAGAAACGSSKTAPDNKPAERQRPLRCRVVAGTFLRSGSLAH